jgi:hypothetical protein
MASRKQIIAAALAAGMLSASTASMAAPLDARRVERLDRSAVLPPAAHPRDAYVRYYMQKKVRGEGDLPFTTTTEVPSLKPGEVVLGLYVLPEQIWDVKGPPRVVIADGRSPWPSFVHGGCNVVNVVLDARTGKTLGSWCNVDDRLPPGPPPRGAPSMVYLPKP